MCGILCCLGISCGAEQMRAKLLEHARRLRHRGPDWSGAYVKDKCILAHERLSIVDVANGAQPLRSADTKQILVVNGEIYNHKTLRKQLKSSVKFKTETDSECIIHLYNEQGIKFINSLSGIFAFCLIDESTDSFTIARDHMGIIPLYYGFDEAGALWVASELKALHDVCIRFEEFPPGHVLTGKIGTSGKLEKWYNPIWHDEKYIPTQKVDLKALRDGLEAAVTQQLMADVPYGVLLSGGLDSSVISALAVKNAPKRTSDGKVEPLRSFSVGLAGSPDLKYAREVADSIKTEHHEVIFTVEEGINALSDVIYHLETFDTTTVRASTPMYLLSRRIKSMGIKMVLSGEGSDEIFGGYLYFHKAPNREEFHKENVRKLKGLHKYDCLRANKSTSAWGVEARVPFLDKEFMDLAMTIDPADKMCGKNGGGRIEKWIVRKAFEGYLPHAVLWRQKEQFSDGVGYSWIDGLKAHAEKVVSDAQMKAAAFRFPENTPLTKESYLYRSIFESHYPQSSARACVPGGPSIACSTPTAILWDESFQKSADPSGRAVAGVHSKSYAANGDASRSETGGDSKSAPAVVATIVPVGGTATDSKHSHANGSAGAGGAVAGMTSTVIHVSGLQPLESL